MPSPISAFKNLTVLVFVVLLIGIGGAWILRQEYVTICDLPERTDKVFIVAFVDGQWVPVLWWPRSEIGTSVEMPPWGVAIPVHSGCIDKYPIKWVEANKYKVLAHDPNGEWVEFEIVTASRIQRVRHFYWPVIDVWHVSLANLAPSKVELAFLEEIGCLSLPEMPE